MLGYVANTDFTWFSFLRDRRLDEVNFWQPSGGRAFRAVSPGAPFFLKLKQPYNAIAGIGFFAHHSVLPAWLAWQTFGEGNGAPSFGAMSGNIQRLRRTAKADGRPGSFEIGCIVLSGCVFFDDADWIRIPRDYARNIVQGKTYELSQGEGARIWSECRAVAAGMRGAGLAADATVFHEADRYGEPVLTRPRLGQGAFRIAVLDAYGRTCAVSTEHSLPVLEAAHIRSYSQGGAHDVSNGICLRSDIHRLFDAGYVTIDEDNRFVVSRRLRDEYDNGKVYYAWHGHEVALPRRAALRPDPTALRWHRENEFVA
ncbi:MAG: HNH endonuclease [Candidatus Krumholzibacteriia bacterium]